MIGREFGGEGEVELEEVANGVRVFSAVEAADDGAAGEGGGFVEFGGDLLEERCCGRFGGAGHFGGRHFAGADAFEGLLPDVGAGLRSAF